MIEFVICGWHYSWISRVSVWYNLYSKGKSVLNSIIEALSSATAAFSFRVYLPRNYEGRKTEELDTQFVWKSLARL